MFQLPSDIVCNRLTVSDYSSVCILSYLEHSSVYVDHLPFHVSSSYDHLIFQKQNGLDLQRYHAEEATTEVLEEK